MEYPRIGDVTKALANYLQAEMARQGMSQVDLETKSGVPDSTLSRYVRGTVKNPRASVLARIARGLGVDWATLMDLAGLTEGLPAREQAGLPSDVAALMAAEPWMVDVVRQIGMLSPAHQRAVITYLRLLLQGGDDPQSPPAR